SELIGTESGAPGPLTAGIETRLRLFDAVTAFLTGVAATQPLLLVLDDLHGADVSSLLLLEFLARERAITAILDTTKRPSVLGTVQVLYPIRAGANRYEPQLRCCENDPRLTRG